MMAFKLPIDVLGWAIEAALKFLSSYVTPELYKQVKTELVKGLRKAAKEQTPDFPYDDMAVEMIAKALGVP